MTCSRQNGGVRSQGVCYVCTKFCHKGHQLEPASEELWISESCGCGSGLFAACPTLNKNNPVPELRAIRGCSVAHETFKAIQTHVKAAARQPNEPLFTGPCEGKLAHYTVEEFAKDLDSSLDFLGFDKTPGSDALLDKAFGMELSLAENIVLLASGGISDSLLTMLSVRDPPGNESSVTAGSQPNDINSSTASFKALKTLVAIGCGDVDEFQAHGDGLATLLKEKGQREESATEKLSHLLLLANGGCGHARSRLSRAHIELFKRLFGTHWLRMTLFHKMLAVPKADLIQILGIAPKSSDILGDHDQEAY